ncbi:VapE domain-containing protein [Parabacteroides sp. ZJ-118]|uniref:VapE domain-containing protein n=1 Tax=Parabacteroides sp. ZJ-118 TaxID=2709398 RepID=UPI0013EDD98B|nr:VapE domain-containing protein [Parabacteroides sp. ZJ-118]
MIKISLFALFGRYKGDASLTGVLENIRGGTYRQLVGEIRESLAAGETERAANQKKMLPAFTPQATYSGKRLDPHITRYNQLVILDIDHVGEQELKRIAPLAAEAPYTVAYFRSPSGDGAKLIAYAATEEIATPGNHRRVYEAVSRWYAARLGVRLDTSGSDIGRLCFVSDDPDLYLAPAYRPWLEGTGELPEGLDPLPLTWKQAEEDDAASGARKRRVASPLEKARRTAERKGAYAEGNRNNFIFVMATRANRLGVKQGEMEAYASTAFADLPAEERLAAIKNAYSHTEQHAIEKGGGASRGRGSVDVVAVEAYISERFQTRKNEVKGYVEVAVKKRRNGSKMVFNAVNDYWVNTLWRNLQKAGHICTLNDIRSILQSDFSETYDPFRDYFEKLPPWDGVTDWIGQLADTVKTTRPDFWRECLRRWIIAAVACATEPGQENHSILLLVGGQGLGKTSWLRNLVPPELRDYLFTGNVDPYSKDFKQMMADCFLIVIDEMSGQSYADLSRLKALASNGVIYQRRPYGRYAETQMRRASFAATVNDLHSLPDDSESRRFLCFEATRIDYQSPIRHADIYAQAYALFRRGEKYWFADDDIRRINKNNETFRQRSPEEELLFTYFRKPERSDTPQYLTASDIMTKISMVSRVTPTRSGVLTLSKVLKKHDFRLVKSNGKRLFEITEITSEQVKANFLRPEQEKENSDPDEPENTKDQKDKPGSTPPS